MYVRRRQESMCGAESVPDGGGVQDASQRVDSCRPNKFTQDAI